MIKHIVAFRFKPDVSDLCKFPDQFSAMRDWICGRNISRRDTEFSRASMVEFETEKEPVDYLESHVHEESVAKEIRPCVETV